MKGQAVSPRWVILVRNFSKGSWAYGVVMQKRYDKLHVGAMEHIKVDLTNWRKRIYATGE